MGILRRGRHRKARTPAPEPGPEPVPEPCTLTLVACPGLSADEPDTVPAVLIAAANELQCGGKPVILDHAGREVIAVIGEGDPATWMPAITDAACGTDRCAGIRRTLLPEGLLAVAARPDGGAGLLVHVNSALEGWTARAAVAAVVKTARRTGWTSRTAALWPLAGIAWRWARDHAAAHAAATAATAATVASVSVAAGTVFALAPVHLPPVGAHPAPSATVPALLHHHARRRIQDEYPHVMPPAHSRPQTINPQPRALTSSPAPEGSGSPSPQPDPTLSVTPGPSPVPTVFVSVSPPAADCLGVIILNVCVAA